MRELLADEPGFMLCGGVPRDWRLRRQVVQLAASEPLPFVDVDAPETHAHLSAQLATNLMALGYEDNIDLADVRNRDRRLSRAIALWAYAATDDDDRFLYGGIRYGSRITTDWDNWAIFDGTDVFVTANEAIETSDPDLLAVATMWDLVVH